MMIAAIEQDQMEQAQAEVLKGIQLGEMNARFEGIDLTQDPLWRDVIKPRLLSGAIDFAAAQQIFHQHYAEIRNA